jgi:DNA-binding transcriptional LysR family regulator
MSNSPNWDEFRIVRAIAEAQSLGGAAERLGLNHSTLFRRLAAMEARLGLKLFERERTGYRPTAAGEDMVALATLMGDTIAEFERRVMNKDIRLSGLVRLAAPPSIGALILPPIIAALAAEYPGLRIDLALTDSAADTMNGEAEVAICVLRAAPRDGLVGRMVAPAPFAIYAAAPPADGRPSSWVFPRDNIGTPQARRWLEHNVEPWRRAATVGGYMMMAELAARGVGAALLPCFVGVTKPELKTIGLADPELDGEVWVVSHPLALRAPRVRAVYDFIAGELERRRAWFAGEAVVEP